MLRLSSCVVVVTMLIAMPVFARQDLMVLAVDKDVGASELWSLGFLYLADIGDEYLVEGDDNAAARLAESGADFRSITTVSRDEEVCLLWPRAPEAHILYSKVLFDLGDGTYLGTLGLEANENLSLMPYETAKLKPRTFPEVKPAGLLPNTTLVTYRPEVQALVDSVRGDTLFKVISQLSGEESVVIDGSPETLLTRYTFSPQCELAATYLREKFEDYGLSAEIQDFWFGWLDLDFCDFVDDDHGWIGHRQVIFRTADGGQVWTDHMPGEIGEMLNDISFPNIYTGWVVGTGPCIYRSHDGGGIWARQYPPAAVDELYAVAFQDTAVGWAAGDSGNIIRTTDGGSTWSGVPSGTSEHIYALHFASQNRGWACGRYGTILAWDGSSWSAQTSGTTEHLNDIQFLDENRGWAAGAGRTVLSTTDGGDNWAVLPVPAEANPYLASVCFVSATDGWVTANDGYLLHTSDGGATWEIIDPGTLADLARVEFTSTGTGYMIGEGCTIAKTTDAGATWQSQGENLPAGAWTITQNVVATLPGTVSDEEVIICGHYDSVTGTDPMTRAPGADDDASGISVVVEAARLMSGSSFERTVRYICFGGEEQGMRGSLVYAANARRAGADIAGVLNLDMIGYSDGRPEPADFVGNSESEWLLDFILDCGDIYMPGTPTRKVVNPAVVLSDHSSFWYAGYSAVFGLEDTPPSTPYIHTEGDTLGTLAQWFLTKFGKLAVAAVAELAVPDNVSGVTERSDRVLEVSAYPNPFRTCTKISFTLGAPGEANVDIFSVGGRWVASLASGRLDAGRHDLVWNGEDATGSRLPAGIYFARLRTSGLEASSKVLLLR